MSGTKEKTKHIAELHSDNNAWIKELGFYKDELKIFKKRLTEVAGKNTGKELMARLEHFQNQFILHDEVADNLLHDLRASEQVMIEAAKRSAVAIDHRAFPGNTIEKTRMEQFIHLYKDLRDDYLKFLSEVM